VIRLFPIVSAKKPIQLDDHATGIEQAGFADQRQKAGVKPG
jgi:hypothetical protein